MFNLAALIKAPLHSGVLHTPASIPEGTRAREDWHYARPVTGETRPFDPTAPVDYSDTRGAAGVGNAWIQENAAALPARVGEVGIIYPDLPGVPSNLNQNDVGHIQQTSQATGHQRQPIMRGPVSGRDESYSNLRAQLLSPTVGTVGAVKGNDGGGTSAQAYFASLQNILNEHAIKTALAYSS